MDASHAIFQTPFAVAPTFTDIPTPEHYRQYPEGEGLGPTLRGWKVCAERAPDYPGVVADGYGFADSPDCEYISGGVNSKGPRAAALARQGNFFQWGFSASPKAMTGEARLVFLNTLAYMRQFDGQGPLVTAQGRAREWMAVIARYLDEGKLADYARKQLPPSIVEESGGDATKAKALLARDAGYLLCADGKFTVDADCKALGIDNRDPGLLTACVEALGEEGAGRDRALRLLQRYTDQTFTTAADWQRWLAATEGRRFFSDRGGCRWFVAPDGRAGSKPGNGGTAR